MIFWDSSAVIPLLVREKMTRRMQAQLERDRHMLVWWATRVECASAISRLEREQSLSPEDVISAFDRLAVIADGWNEVSPTRSLRQMAQRLLRVHPLRAADALQLAAAVVASEQRPPSLLFSTLDGRLESAARREGFAIVDPQPAKRG